MVKQFNIKTPIKIPTQTNNNFPLWEFVATLPNYYCLNSESVAKNELLYFSKYGVFLSSGFKSAFGLDYSAKSLQAFKDFASCVRSGKVTSIVSSVNVKVKTTPFNDKKFAGFLSESIDEIITLSAIDSNDSEILGDVRKLMYDFIFNYSKFSSLIFSATKNYNKYIYENIEDYEDYKTTYKWIQDQNLITYSKLPKNFSFYDYIKALGVSSQAVEEEMNNHNNNSENNTGKKGTGKTTTNSNITPLLIGVAIIALVIYLKKRRK
jgi:hypothetical protein